MLSEDEKWIRKASEVFRLKSFGFYQADREARLVAGVERATFPHRGRGRLEKARRALQISIRTAAQRSKVSGPLWERLEQRELKGNVSLRVLAKAAEAIDCELVYAFRPKGGGVFSAVIWKQLWPKILLHRSMARPLLERYPEHRRVLLVAAIAGDLFRLVKIRKELGWSQRLETPTMDELNRDLQIQFKETESRGPSAT